ncbi:hypothetical protein C8Q80DRAFT_1267930 [Daedaleopsis nitida]|nr:hypothetical protein C8Q80DRAFT_1267930 [Daedaleopsis nitida]
MSMTCRALRSGGARYLLEDGVVLSSTEQIISFAKFVLSDSGGSRVRHLRSLEIFAGGVPPRAVLALRGVISHPLLKLDSLALLDAEAILISDSDASNGDADENSLFHGFASLTTLKHLTMDRTDGRSFDLIRSLSSSLVTASLKLERFTTWSTPPTDPDERNPILILIRSLNTLEELSGNGFEVDPLVIKYDAVYPLVRKLTMSYSSPTAPGIIVYINAYPHLEYLSLRLPSEVVEEDAEERIILNDSLVRRNTNREDQESYNCTWARLKEVSGTVMDLYELGLISHVPTLRVLDLISTRSDGYLADVVLDIRPSHLVISVAGTTVLAENGMLSTALRQSDQLRVLELEVRLLPDEDGVGLNVIMDAIRASLAAFSSLRSLVLTLSYQLLLKRWRRLQAREEASLLEQELRSMDLRAEEHRLCNVLTFLTKVSVVTSGCPHPDLDDDTSSMSSSEEQNQVTEDFARFMLEDDEGW